jgi:hypothetical protein
VTPGQARKEVLLAALLESIPRAHAHCAGTLRPGAATGAVISALLAAAPLAADPDGSAGRPFLDGYFPRLLRERFAEHFQDHVLRREIVATGAVNYTPDPRVGAA